ncbi:hypothetical protein C2S51_003385 [Perilla frutescens var. frutescens]|nr:hypothetical protein C2S51_003385 [Perilla frutescens var. frutescens]
MLISNLKFALKHSCKTTAQIHQVHAQAITSGLFSLYTSSLLSHILHSFPLSSPQQNANGGFIYITKIFNLIPNPSNFDYNNIIRAHTFLQSPHTALIFFREMRQRQIEPDSHTFNFVLKACGLLQNSNSLARVLHAQVTKYGFLDNVYVRNALSRTYCRSGDVDGAKGVFEESSLRDVVSYNVMLVGFVKAGEIDNARKLFDEMPSSFRDGVSYNVMLGGFVKAGDIDIARNLFKEMPSSFRDGVSYTAMIDGLSKGGEIGRARELFDEMPNSLKDVVTYTAMIDGLFKAGEIDRARGLIDEMPSSVRNAVSYTAMIDGLFKAGEIDRARELFDKMPNSFRNAVSYTAMIDGLFKAGEIDHARGLFDEMPSSFRNVVSYTAMIDGFFKAGEIDRARELFDEMPSSLRNVFSYNAMIDGLSKGGEIGRARDLFDEMPNSLKDVVTYTAMIDGLFKAGEIDRARGLFDEMPSSFRNVVSYTAMIDGLFKAGEIDRARELFDKMPSSFRNVVSYTAMIDGLFKAGEIDHARGLFDELPSSYRENNIALWTAMLMGLAIHGHSGSVLRYFSKMLEDGVKPDGMAILAVLVGCNHSGLIYDANRIFVEMESVYGVPREAKHYRCMVDILARAGLIKEVREMIEAMSIGGDEGVWGALLGGCKKHGVVEEAEEAAEHLMRMTPEEGSVYSSLAHIYANSGRWDDVVKVQRLKDSRWIKKIRGCSWIVLDGIKHEFLAGDRSHTCTKEIHLVLNGLHKCELLKH